MLLWSLINSTPLPVVLVNKAVKCNFKKDPFVRTGLFCFKKFYVKIGKNTNCGQVFYVHCKHVKWNFAM